MQEVGANVRDLPVERPDPVPGLLPVPASLLLPGEVFLGVLQLFFKPREVRGQDDRPVRERGEADHSKVDPDDSRRGVGGNRDLPLRLDHDEPFVAGSPDGHVLDCAQNLPALAVCDPSDLREKDPGIGTVELHALWIPEGIVLALLPERWEACPLLEEVLVGPVEILEGLLENLGMDTGEPDRLGIPFPEREEIRRADIA